MTQLAALMFRPNVYQHFYQNENKRLQGNNEEQKNVKRINIILILRHKNM